MHLHCCKLCILPSCHSKILIWHWSDVIISYRITRRFHGHFSFTDESCHCENFTDNKKKIVKQHWLQLMHALSMHKCRINLMYAFTLTLVGAEQSVRLIIPVCMLCLHTQIFGTAKKLKPGHSGRALSLLAWSISDGKKRKKFSSQTK